MTRGDLILRLARRNKLTRPAAASVVDAVLGGLEQGLRAGKRVELRGVGSFRPRHYGAYIGRNPATDEPIPVPVKVSVAFRPSSEILQRLRARGSA